MHARVKRRIGPLLALVITAAGGLTASPGSAAPAAMTPKLLVVGMDGLNWAQVIDAHTPNLDALAAGGTFGESMLYCGAMAASMSGPGWSTIATGVWPDKHGVKNNTFFGSKYSTYPDFLTRLERANSALSTFSAVDWKVLHTKGTFGSAIDARFTYDGDRDGYAATDKKVVADAVKTLRDKDPDAGFVYLGNTDAVAHDDGTGADYLAAVEKQDAQLGQLMATIRNRPTYASENWRIVVATDHGHKNPDGGHGGCDIDARRTWVLSNDSGGGRPIDTRVVDVAASALQHFGVSAGLDGKPISVRSTDPFDALVSGLRGRVDESDIPSSLRGFTHTPPPNWSVWGNMPSGGVAEWRGWSFTTDEFWTRTEAWQQRESNVRSRGVFAVADSDEFNDRWGGSSFDSSLRTAPFAVAGGGTAVVRYGTHFRAQGSQTGDVSVSFDGGAQRLIRRYDDDNAIARMEAIAVPVPAGATSMTITFRYYDASNNWYWVIDDVTVTMS